MTVGDFKANFSSVLKKVMDGEEVQILYGRAKKPVACLNKIKEINISKPKTYQDLLISLKKNFSDLPKYFTIVGLIA